MDNKKNNIYSNIKDYRRTQVWSVCYYKSLNKWLLLIMKKLSKLVFLFTEQAMQIIR